MQRVVDQIDQHLLDLIRVSLCRGQICLEIKGEVSSRDTNIKFAQFDNALNDLVEVSGLAVCWLLAREGEKIAHQVGGTIAFTRNFLQVCASKIAQFMSSENQFEISFDHGQWIVELVGDA